MPIARLKHGLCRLVKRFTQPASTVAVLRLQGVIGVVGKFKQGMDAATLDPIIEKAFAAPRLRAVALAINSPGGSPVQSDLIYRGIRREAVKKDVPVLAFIEDAGASGGYWLACAGDEIFALDSSIVGSIGVIAGGFGFQEFIRRHGIERRIYTQGENKSMLDPFKPENPKDIEHLKALQKDVHEAFKELVRSRRGDRLEEDGELFSGKFWSGRQALPLGLIDALGDLKSICRERYGDDIAFKHFAAGKGWFARKMGVFSPALWMDAALAAVESNTLWARLGR